MKFENKVVLITGSGTGIGMTVAKKFVENGASVIILGRRKEPLESTSEMLTKIINEKNSNGFVKIFSGVDVSDENVTSYRTPLSGKSQEERFNPAQLNMLRRNPYAISLNRSFGASRGAGGGVFSSNESDSE